MLADYPATDFFGLLSKNFGSFLKMIMTMVTMGDNGWRWMTLGDDGSPLKMIMTIVTTAGDRREQSSSMPAGNRGAQFGRFSGRFWFPFKWSLMAFVFWSQFFNFIQPGWRNVWCGIGNYRSETFSITSSDIWHQEESSEVWSKWYKSGWKLQNG